jgi:hypothetical protein
MTNPVDSSGNVKVDFVWGNMPLQPDDARDSGHKLNPALDNHIIATSGYEGFPGFVTGGAFDDTIANVVVPNVVGATLNSANSTLVAAGLSQTSTTTTTGATSNNNGKVKTQNPASGATVNTGTNVALVVYNYVAPFTGYTETDYTSFGTSVILNNILFSAANAAILANPTNYVMTITGSVDLDGTYPVTAVTTGSTAGYSGNNHLAIATAHTFGYHESAVEGGTVTVTLA